MVRQAAKQGWAGTHQNIWSEEKLLSVRQQVVALLYNPHLQQHWPEAWELVSSILLSEDPHSPLKLAADVDAWLQAGLVHALVEVPGAQARSAVRCFTHAWHVVALEHIMLKNPLACS